MFEDILSLPLTRRFTVDDCTLLISLSTAFHIHICSTNTSQNWVFQIRESQAWTLSAQPFWNLQLYTKASLRMLWGKFRSRTSHSTVSLSVAVSHLSLPMRSLYYTFWVLDALNKAVAQLLANNTWHISEKFGVCRGSTHISRGSCQCHLF